MLPCVTKKRRRVAGYIRVSTAKQGASGLGLEAQKAAIAAHAASSGCVVLERTKKSIADGRANRVQLDRAIAHATRAKASLVIAKLDRLARNVEVIAHLMNAGADFVACDMPGFYSGGENVSSRGRY